MAIFQPTNITPDLISGEENGVVMIPNLGTDPVTVSWQVNGNSQLVAYQIDFYRNLPNEASPIATTNKITLGTPFSPVSADGTIQRFSCQVAYNKFGFAAVSASNYEGKMKITQWWGATDDESVVQRSLSVFRVNNASSLGITGISGYNGIYYFSGAFAPPSPDHGNTTLLWARWTASRNGNVVYDTGKVWGATSYNWSPGVFYPGEYTVTFSAESSQGEQLSDTATFTSAPSVVTVNGLINAYCDRSVGAVAVDLNYSSPTITAAFTGTPTVRNNQLEFDAGDEAVWNVPSILDGNEWAFFWEGTFYGARGLSETVNVVEITQKDGTTFGMKLGTDGKLSMIFPNGTTLVSTVNYYDTYRFVVYKQNNVPTQPYICYFGIYSEQDESYSYALKSMTGFTEGDIVSVTLRGISQANKWGIIYGSEHTILDNYAKTWDATPYGDGTHWEWYAEDEIDPHVATASIPWSLYMPLYRLNPDGSMRWIMEAVPGESYPIIYDYEAANGQSYQYFLMMSEFNDSEQEKSVTLLTSNTVTPCIWEWDLIEAEKTDGSGTNTVDYTPVNVFRFRANVSSGSIGNGAAPSIYSTFTRYPVVMRDTQNRKSGTLTGLIGWVTAPGQYADDNATMESIRNLSANKNTLFLRSRRGEFMKVAISGEITTTANDNSPKQEITASVPWVEIGPVDGSVASIKAINTEGV